MLRSNEIDMVHGPLMKNVFLFSVPLMATALLQMLFNAADIIVVGKFSGEIALAAVGATSSLVFFITSLFNGISVGCNVVISRCIGARDSEKVQHAVHTSMWLSLVLGLVLTVVGCTISRPFLELLGTPEEIIGQSDLYMKIYFAGSLFLLVYDFGTAVLRSKGDTTRPIVYLTLSGVLNVALNLIFVIVFHMGVAGVALATIVAQGVASVLVWLALRREEGDMKVELARLHLDKVLAKDILHIGIPAGLQSIIFSLSNLVVQSSINSFGNTSIIAGNSAAINLENFVYIGMSAFMQACISFTSQNVGAKQIGKIKEIMWMTLLLCVGSGFLVAGILYCNGHFFLSFYTNSVDVENWGMYRLLYVTLLLPIQGVSDVMIGSMRGMGYSILPTVCMLAGICGIRLVWLWFIFPLFPTLSVVYLCFPISWTCTGLLQIVLWIVSYRKFLKNNMSEKEVQYK